MYPAIMAMAWLYLNPDTAALFVGRALQAAVAVTVDIPETNTAKELLPYLRTPTGTFERTRTTRTGSDCIVWILGGELWLTILLLDDGLLHVVIQPRDVT